VSIDRSPDRRIDPADAVPYHSDIAPAAKRFGVNWPDAGRDTRDAAAMVNPFVTQQ
jgi:hypothetical protein